jgi:hypothetical protein
MLKQIAYNLETNVPAAYTLSNLNNLQNRTITIRSNFPWVVSAVSDDDDILQNKEDLIGTEGEANTGLGNPLPITLQPESYDVSKTGKTAIITLTSQIDNTITWDIPITVVESLYVGMFGGNLTNTGGVWQFEKALYVQNTVEINSITWSDNTNNSQGVSAEYIHGKANTWTLYSNTYNNPAATRCVSKNGAVASETDSDYHWYLPAQKQLQAVWVSHNSFERVYRFSDSSHWSSTSSGIAASWVVNFSDGRTSNVSRENGGRLRCVREVEVTPP